MIRSVYRTRRTSAAPTLLIVNARWLNALKATTLFFCLAATVTIAGDPSIPKETLAGDRIEFNQTIRPILSEYCFACHGPDAHDRAADLRLDEFEAALDYGAIEPGDPESSLMVERILSDDPDLMMPPPETGKTIEYEAKQKIIEWIRQGAEYEAHWAFQPVPEAVEIPKDLSPELESWSRNAIDPFVAAKLSEKSLAPSEEASRATWLRRVTFDLTGLPPTLADLEAFEADSSPQAYELVVERLLQSSAYGERMANMWLDVARYADTFGYQNDVAMEVWPYRNWVVEAFTQNMPYDQFVIEQLAGDLLPNATPQQQVATAFNRLHRQTNEGGSVPEEFRLAGIADRTTTAGTAFLGLTLECCRCHDHKFDPLKQKEFYQMSDFFSDIDELGLYSHFTFSQPTPAMLLYEGDQESQHAAIRHAVLEAARLLEIETHRATVAARERLANAFALESSADDELAFPTPRQAVYQTPLDGDVPGILGTATKCDGDSEIKCADAPQFGRVDPFTYSIWVHPATHQPRTVVFHQSRAAEDSGFRGIQLTLENGSPEFSMIHFWPGNALRVQAIEPIPIDAWTHLVVTHDGSGSASGVAIFVNGLQIETKTIRDGLTRDVLHRKEWGDMDASNIKLAIGARFRDIGFRDGHVDELQVYDVRLSPAEVFAIYRDSISPTLNREIPELTDSARQRLLQDHLVTVEDDGFQNAFAKLDAARKAENTFVTKVRELMTMRHYPDAPPTYILERGDYSAKTEPVEAATPELSGALPVARGDRLALAKWITDERNPLTARVIVNRMWHLFFGRGLVASLEDFGSQGSPPSHPLLLDYLSREFMNQDWDLHWLCREIVLSASYRQSSEVTESNLLDIDPKNVWLARGPKHRLSAEQLRDAVLAASGLLVDQVGGPSVMPYQPAGLWKEAGTGKSYQQSKGDGLYRRSLYTFWKRTAPPPSMLTFDATSRESCIAKRELTTTPLQALVFLNDPQYIESSRVLAVDLISTHQEHVDSRWTEAFRRLVTREPTTEELTVLNELYTEQLAYFQSMKASEREAYLSVGTRPVPPEIDAVDLAASTVVVQAIVAYDETIMLR